VSVGRRNVSLLVYAATVVLAWLLHAGLSQRILTPSSWIPAHTLITAAIVMLCSAGAFNLFVWQDYVPVFARWLAPALVVTGFLEFLHALSLFPSGDSVLYPPQANLWFWAAARWLTGLAFLADALILSLPGRSPRATRQSQSLALFGLLVLATGFFYVQRHLPVLRSPDLAPSPAELLNVVVPALLTALASLLLSSRPDVLDQPEARQFVNGLDFLVVSQLLLLFSDSTYDLYSLFAHPVKLAGYAYLFASLVTATVIRPYQKLRRFSTLCIDALTEAIDAHDTYTRGHSARVEQYAELIGHELGLSPAQMRCLSMAARLHDVGKLNIPDRVLSKPGPLTDDEWALIRQHPQRSARIIESLHDPPVQQAVLEHHERVDGRGYPSGKQGEEINLLARIIAVADTYDALTSDRPYRERCSPARAWRIIAEAAGTQLDPRCMQAFQAAFPRIKAYTDSAAGASLLVASARD
jgi:HD-GYP domain-containing protein (c-di-GMP phosphodiesterase class II)